MKKSGKILFFNPNDGTGIIITAQKGKIPFNVQEWDDFDTMPSLGLEVVFDYEDTQALNISRMPDDFDPSLEEKQDKEDESFEESSPDDKSDIDKELKAELEKTTILEKEIIPHEEPFEKEKDIDVLKEQTEDYKFVKKEDEPKEHKELEKDDTSDEESEREENVTLSLNINIAVSNYFKRIEEHIKNRINYKKVPGRLDYMITRRFLWTMFNNLSEIDIHLITPKIRALSNDLKLTADMYDDLVRKTKYPSLAYEEVFLSCQNEYMKIKDGAQEMIDKLSRLRTEEKHVGSILKVKKEEVAKDIHTQEFELLTHELKSLNGAYVDIVHMMAELDQRYKSDLEQLHNFEKEYREDFYKLFSKATHEHKENLEDILSAQAFLLDSKLWQEVKTSKAVKSYFKKSSISGELNTRTYLKYYLDSLDETKAVDENRKLFDLYEYLLTVHTDYIIVVASHSEDALDYESDLKHLPKGYKVKSFVDEKKALKWAIKNSVKIVIIEDTLQSMDVTSFLKYYQKYVLITPKVILLGNKPKASSFSITKLLSKSVTPRVISNNVKELLEEK